MAGGEPKKKVSQDPRTRKKAKTRPGTRIGARKSYKTTAHPPVQRLPHRGRKAQIPRKSDEGDNSNLTGKVNSNMMFPQIADTMNVLHN